ncbi:MAG TPA: LD-carboxypeptidase [Ignavibacteriaceae bacterium]|nr:LD-carboxypeptidase [Ignavibacteriaceae bacterium]
MKRRNFIKTLSTATLAAAVTKPTNALVKNSQRKKLIKPARLKNGDTIALVTPGSHITEQEKEESINNLRGLSFNVIYSDRLMQKNGYFSATDKERAADLNEMFERKDVQGIMCARGGYGCARILPYLDYDLIEDNPKALIGFSDATALQYAIFKNSGLITFHGPVSISTFSSFSVRNFERVLINPTFELELLNSTTGNNYNPYGITVISGGIAEGELVGGNLSICVSLIGTEYDIDFSDKIIFLEEFLEEPYRVDRMLTQLIQAGKFENAAGIALGLFKLCEPNKTNPAFSGSFSLMEVLKDRLGNLGIPVVYGLSFGHIADKFTLPFGGKAQLNTETKQLKLTESAVL